ARGQAPDADRAQKISATQQRREPPAFSISSNGTSPTARPAVARTARCGGRRAAAPAALNQARRGDRAMQLPAKAAFWPASSSTTAGAYSPARAAGTAGSAKPAGQTTRARPASTLITTLVWYSPGA